MIDDAMRDAAEALVKARETIGDAAAGSVGLIAQARDLVTAIEAATEDPGAAARVRKGAYHLAGLLDALGLLPFDAAAAVAGGIEDYASASEPPAES